MTSIDELSPPSTSLKASDLEGNDVTLTIAGYDIKEFDETDNKTGQQYKSRKPIFSFQETEKTFVCNLTNRRTIAASYGKEMDEWIGKPITLFPTVVPFGDKMVEAVRVRIVKQAAGAPKFLKNGPKDDHPFAPGNDLDSEVPF
jgi:hypothetical protein